MSQPKTRIYVPLEQLTEKLTSVSLKSLRLISEIFDKIGFLLTILFSLANLYNLTPLTFLAEYIGG